MALAAFKVQLRTWETALSNYEQQNYDKALALFEEIADSGKPCMNVALIHRERDDLEQALHWMTLAIAMDPSLAVAYFERGLCYYSLGMKQEALDDFSDAALRMRGDREIKGLRYKLYAAEILFNKGVVLLELGRRSDGLACLGKAVLKKVLPSHHKMHETLAYPDKKYDLYKVTPGVLFRPTDSKMKFLEEYDDILDQPILHKKSLSLNTQSLIELDKTLPGLPHRKASSALSFTTTIAPSESASVIYTPSIQSASPTRKRTITRRHTLHAGVIPSTTRVELERQMGKDFLIPSTEISTIPCAGLRITHGALAGLMAFRFVVSLDQKITFPAPRRSIVANFLLDTGLGRSLMPPETLLALGYTGRLTLGTEVSMIIQGVKTKCVVGEQGDAGRLASGFLTSGSLTFHFDSAMNAPILYVADQLASHHFIPRTVEPTKRMSLKEVIASLLSFRKQLA
ncbi:hypothetical protein BDZ89DRAFT_1067387 [Hymenopellis radicata]|nr:hypothetical protein BDZ89DRAFT_1067387 [Hymenopellis radicata]